MVNQDADGYTKTLHRWKILKNKLTENQKNAKTAYKLSGGPFFTFSLPGGGKFSPLASRQLHQWSANFFARRTGFAWHYFAERPSIK